MRLTDAMLDCHFRLVLLTCESEAKEVLSRRRNGVSVWSGVVLLLLLFLLLGCEPLLTMRP